MPAPPPLVSGEFATRSLAQTTTAVAAMSSAPTPIANTRKSMSTVAATSSKPTSVASTRKSTSSPDKAIPLVNIVSDDEEEEDVDAPAYDFYSDTSDDEEDDVSNIEEIEAEESPPAGQAENPPSGLWVTFDTGSPPSERQILSEPEVLEKFVQDLKV